MVLGNPAIARLVLPTNGVPAHEIAVDLAKDRRAIRLMALRHAHPLRKDDLLRSQLQGERHLLSLAVRRRLSPRQRKRFFRR